MTVTTLGVEFGFEFGVPRVVGRAGALVGMEDGGGVLLVPLLLPVLLLLMLPPPGCDWVG